jgi:hypothetical protein
LLEGASRSVAAVFSSTIGIKVMILFIEAIEKRSILLNRYRYSSPELPVASIAKVSFGG